MPALLHVNEYIIGDFFFFRPDDFHIDFPSPTVHMLAMVRTTINGNVMLEKPSEVE